MRNARTYKEKIDYLRNNGYAKIDNQLIYKLKASKEVYAKMLLNKIFKASIAGNPIVLVVFFGDSYCTYSKNHINERSVDEIMEGTRKFLNGLIK